MKLSESEVLILAMAINPAVEYYAHQSGQPWAEARDKMLYAGLKALQEKLEAAAFFSDDDDAPREPLQFIPHAGDYSRFD